MNAGQLTMPRHEAREKLAYVRRQLHKRADAEYEQLEVAYRAAAQGRPLIVLSQALALAPRDEKGRPRIAIAPADFVQTKFISFVDAVRFDSVRRGEDFRTWGRRPLRANTRAQMPGMLQSVPDGFALVPIVPPDVRGNHSLATHFILWEIEQWADRAIGAQPDRDPLLLSHLGGELYAVVAEWDLTEIERAIMAGRATR